MELYIIRHATAVEANAYISDENRYLSDKGKKEAQMMGTFLKALKLCFNVVLSSPLIRAVDTAKLLIKFSGSEGASKIEICDFLLPGAHFQNLAQELKKYENEKRIAILGHSPDVNNIISKICFQSDVTGVKLKNCAIAFIDEVTLGKTLSGKLRWIIEPDLLQE